MLVTTIYINILHLFTQALCIFMTNAQASSLITMDVHSVHEPNKYVSLPFHAAEGATSLETLNLKMRSRNKVNNNDSHHQRHHNTGDDLIITSRTNDVIFENSALKPSLNKWHNRPVKISNIIGIINPYKIYGDGSESKFPPVLEFLVQRVQAYFSIYKYEDLSRPSYNWNKIVNNTTNDDNANKHDSEEPENDPYLEIVDEDIIQENVTDVDENSSDYIVVGNEDRK